MSARRELIVIIHLIDLLIALSRFCTTGARPIKLNPYEINCEATLHNLTLGRARKVIPPPWYKGVGGGVDGTPPRSF